jgi:hypothetical protein
MWILNLDKHSDGCLEGLAVFNPNNLPVKKVAIFKNRAIVIDPNAQHHADKRSNKIVVNGITYKFCSQCSQFLALSCFRPSKRKNCKDGLNNYCIECAKCLAALKYLQNREYYLIKSALQYGRKCEKAGFPKDRRLIANRKHTPQKHSHPWSRPGVWANGGPVRGQRKK